MFARKKRENHGNAFKVTDVRGQLGLQNDLVAPLWHVVESSCSCCTRVRLVDV